MKKGFFIFISLAITSLSLVCHSVRLSAQVVTDSSWSEKVKTVTLYKNGVELEAPVLLLGSADRLLLRFDVLDAEAGNFRWRIRHCDSQWRVDDLETNEFITGFAEGAVDNYNSSFTTLTAYNNYYQYIPAEYSQLLLSGNYIVEVVPQDEPDSIVLTKRFWVTENSLKVEAAASAPYDGGNIKRLRQVEVTVDNDADYQGDLLQPTLNPEYLHVVVRQNGRMDTERELKIGGYSRGALCYWQHEENIFEGGNTFRYFDISNIRTAMYNVQQIEEIGREWYAILRPLEIRADKPFMTDVTLNGGMKVNVWDRTNKQTEADYVYVTFVLPCKQPYMSGSVHVVGALTDWRLDDHSRMEYDPSLRAYTLQLQLKQGYYAYQLIYLPLGEKRGKTSVLEGDHFEMQNDYTVWVYYRPPGERYDRLVGTVRL